MSEPLEALLFVVKGTCIWPRRDEGQEWPWITASLGVGPYFATSAPITDSGEDGDRMLIDFNIQTIMYVIGMSRKAKVTLLQAMRAQRGSRGIALLFL